MKVKFNYLWLSVIVILLIIRSTEGQNIKSEEKIFRFPEKNFLSQSVLQNKSPIQFESIEIFFDKKGKMPILNWKLKNNSLRTVKEFVVAFNIKTNISKWKGFAGHIEYGSGTNEKIDLILPQKTYQETNYENISLMSEDELRYLFPYDKESGNDMYIIIYGMIKKVVLDDGFVYEENSKIFSEFR